MKRWLGLIVLVGMSVSLGTALQSRAAQDADRAEEDDERLKAVKELLEKSVDWYDVSPDAGGEAALRPQVVLQWRNAVRVNTGAALLAVWTDQGRPEAMASIFQNGNNICHEFTSLFRSQKIVVRDQTRVVWAPAKGVEFRDVPDAPAPAEDRSTRLRQTKSLAGRFAAKLPVPQPGISNPEVLRLLPRPLYRYDLKDSQGGNPTLRDGAMVAFVMGTDPEVVLLVEAIERDDKLVWQYAFASATAYTVEAGLGDQIVWSNARKPEPNSTNLTKSMIQIFRPIP